MFSLRHVLHTVNGVEHRSIYMEYDDGSCNWVCSEVKTPNCGWVPDNCDPSFDCKQCDNSCPEFKKWEDFYKDL